MAEITRKELILALAAVPLGRDETDSRCRGRLAGVNLSGLDLSGLDLSWIDLCRANLARPAGTPCLRTRRCAR